MSEKVQIGSIITGKVVKIKPFGAIISLPDNSQGLVHISHISKNFVQNISDELEIGEEVTVKVLSIDATSGKISLSIKDAVQPPKDRHENNSHTYESQSNSSFNKRNVPKQQTQNTFEDKFKEWLKDSNERQAGLNKRNKRR